MPCEPFGALLLSQINPTIDICTLSLLGERTAWLRGDFDKEIPHASHHADWIDLQTNVPQIVAGGFQRGPCLIDHRAHLLAAARFDQHVKPELIAESRQRRRGGTKNAAGTVGVTFN